MITLSSPREQRRLEEALKDPYGVATFFELWVDDHELGDRIIDGSWGQDASGAISVDFSLAARLDVDADDTPSAFGVSVNGISIPQMVGLVSLPTENEDQTTEFLAASARAEANRSSLNEVTQFSGWTPDAVAYETLRGLPYFPGYMQIAPLKSPLLDWDIAHNAAFGPEEKRGAIISRLEEQTSYKIRDNVYGGVNVSLGLEPPGPESDYHVYDAKDFIKWRRPPRKERRYSEVVVFRRNEDGTDAFEPRRAEIRYGKKGRRALKDASLWIELEGEGDDAPRRARNLAVDMATRLGHGVFAGSATMPHFDPLLETQDVLWVYQDWEDIAGLWSGLWLLWVDTYQHNKADLTTEITFSAALIEKQEIKVPTLAMAGVSGGVAKTIFYLGTNARGFWFNSEFAEEWIGLNATGGWVDLELSAGQAEHDSKGFLFDVSEGIIPTPLGSNSSGFWFFPDSAGEWVGTNSRGAWMEASLSGGRALRGSQGFLFDI